ncbi:MAG: hypothetical protein ACRC1J_03285, partial [Sandaracinobacteroides sp.]
MNKVPGFSRIRNAPTAWRLPSVRSIAALILGCTAVAGAAQAPVETAPTARFYTADAQTDRRNHSETV